MDVDYDLTIVGGDTPEIIISGGIHGDEPAGVWAVQKLREILTEDDVNKPIGLLVANPQAVQEDTRYTETDLNRSFPGDSKSEVYEDRLAAELSPIIQSAEATLDLHSTHSSEEPFAIVSENTSKEIETAIFYMSLSKIVLSPFAETKGSIVQYPTVLEVEVGYQHSESARENALFLAKQFLSSQNALLEDSDVYCPMPWTDSIVFKLEEKIDKDGVTDLFVNNFTTVPANTTYAQSKDTIYRSGSEFSPVLMSEQGYETMLGYKSKNIGWFSEIVDE